MSEDAVWIMASVWIVCTFLALGILVVAVYDRWRRGPAKALGPRLEQLPPWVKGGSSDRMVVDAGEVIFVGGLRPWQRDALEAEFRRLLEGWYP